MGSDVAAPMAIERLNPVGVWHSFPVLEANRLLLATPPSLNPTFPGILNSREGRPNPSWVRNPFDDVIKSPPKGGFRGQNGYIPDWLSGWEKTPAG